MSIESYLEKLRTIAIQSRTYNHRATVRIPELEKDKRRQPKAVRELVEAGYLDSDGATITDKIYNLTDQNEPDLLRLWDESRKTWNDRKNHVFVRLDTLPIAEQKYIIEHQQDFKFFWCHENVIDYSYKPEEKYFAGPFPLGEANKKADQLFDKSRWHYQLVISSDALEEHARATLNDEKIAWAYTQNASWGFCKLGLLTEDEVKFLRGNQNLFCPNGGDSTKNAELWNDEFVTAEVDRLEKGIARAREELGVLFKLSREVKGMGGWDKFREAYRAAVAVALEKKEE